MPDAGELRHICLEEVTVHQVFPFLGACRRHLHPHDCPLLSSDFHRSLYRVLEEVSCVLIFDFFL